MRSRVHDQHVLQPPGVGTCLCPERTRSTSPPRASPDVTGVEDECARAGSRKRNEMVVDDEHLELSRASENAPWMNP